MKLITLPHRIIITQARNFREFRLLQADNYSGNRLSKLLQMWAVWQKIKGYINN